ncbi:MAG: class I adenylate-forming enzyme family protein [Burkholderiaceae bacterium]
MNITDPIVRQCVYRPDALALIENGEETTYRQLLHRVVASMEHLRAAGVQRHQHVALDVDLNAAAIVVILALLRMGASVSIVRSTYSLAERNALMKRHEVAYIVHSSVPGWCTPDPTLPSFTSLLLKDVTADPSVGPMESMAAIDAHHDASDDICLISTTSGTTGIKKSVALTHAEFFNRLGLDQKLWLKESGRIYLAINLETSLAKTLMIRTLSTGNALIIASGRDPVGFFDVVNRDRPTRIVTGTGVIPLLIESERHHPQRARLHAPTAAAITVTGSEIPVAQLQWMMTRLGPNVQVQLGSTEASQTGFVDAATIMGDPSISSVLLPWVCMEALDDHGHVLPAGQEGLLRIKSPSMAREYFRDPQATAQSFRDGWFHPGDIGAVDTAGRIRMSGRFSSLINMGGNKINPLLIERLLNRIPAILECAVIAASPNDMARSVLTAVVVPRFAVDKDQLTQQIRNACASDLGAEYVPSAVAFSSALPRNSGGKVMVDELQRSMAAALASRNG